MSVSLGFSLQKQYDVPTSTVIALLNAAGFSAVSPVWSKEMDVAKLSRITRAHGMSVQSIHAAHQGITWLWQPDADESVPVKDGILQSIDDCARNDVPVLVMHGWHGFYYDFIAENLDFRHFDNIVRYAEKQGVSIAFENLEGEEFLHALLSRYRSQKHIGYCYDAGHEHCYPHTLDFIREFGDRLIMTHLNDNLGQRGKEPTGIDDLHFLPFDGTIDWKENIARLQRCPHQAILNFELKIVSQSSAPEDLIYSDLSLKEYLTRAAERARQIAKMYLGEKR